MGNGDGQDVAPYAGNHRKLYQGRALVVVRSSKHVGPIHLTATAPGLSEGVIEVQTKSAIRVQSFREARSIF